MSLHVTGDRIRHARLLRRLTSRVVSDAMGWAPATQTRLEQAQEKELDKNTALRLAETLRVSVNFLCAPTPSPLGANGLLFRAPKSVTQQERDSLAEYMRMCGDFAEWLDSRHHLPPVTIPRLHSGDDVTDAARAVRGVFGIGADQPIGHLMHNAERCGVIVVVRTLQSTDPDLWNRAGDTSIERPDRGERHFGCSAWTGTYAERPIMLVKSIESWERTRWTVAHELGHIVLHHQELDPDAELTASAFASELLAPAGTLVAQLPEHVTLRELVPLKMQWGISLGALIRHLRHRQLISHERADTLSRQLYTRVNPGTGRTWGMDEPGWDERVVEKPRLLSRWAERCAGTADPEAIHQLTGMWPSDLLRTLLTAQRRANGAITSVPRQLRGSDSSTVVSLSARRDLNLSSKSQELGQMNVDDEMM